jgi:hypothetical protein
MFDRFGYRSAFYLSALIAVLHGSLLVYSLTHLSILANQIAIYVVAALAIFAGLWLLSKIARYLGAAFYILSAGAAAFAFFTAKAIVMSVAVVWAVSMGVLSLGGAFILLFSKSFDREFEASRERRPRYKKYLAGALAIVVVTWFVVATSIDLMNLTSG